jgi:predicted transcriptional regulator
MVKKMNLNEIIKIVEGNLFTNHEPKDVNIQINGACAADLMSDVLTSIKPDALLLTGLCNPQVVRTAQMADVSAIVFVRGKRPQSETIELASCEGIPLISSPFGMFEICGRLYQAGLPSLESNIFIDNNGA